MSLPLNFVPSFNGSSNDYWKAHMRFFLKSIHVWHIVEIGWTPPETTIVEWTVPQRHSRVVIDKTMNAIYQALSPSKFPWISHCETAQEAWEILETTYEGTKLVKSAKLQMLVSQFEGINMVSLSKKISDAKLVKKILKSLHERFRIKVTTIEESKDLDDMKIEELVGSLQTYEFS